MNIDLVTQVCIVLLQVAAAYLSVRIYQHERLGWPWMAITAGFLIFALRRVLTFLTGLGIAELSFPAFIDSFLPVVGNLCYVIGLASLCKRFEQFKLLERTVTEKIANLTPFPKKRR